MLIDISVDLNPQTPVYPGDPAMELENLASIEAGSRHCLNRMRLTVHTGTHLDAPAHYIAGGKTIDQLPLERFCGDCQVVDMTDRDIIDDNVVDRRVAPDARRVLFKTVDPARPDQPFGGITEPAVRRLIDSGVQLVGIDRLSLDVSDDMACHRLLLGAEVALLECLNLARTESRWYRLWCLPLKLTGLEGAPCRAVLTP